MSETQNAVSEVQSNIPKTFALKEFTFRFKKDKLGNQRPTVKMNAPVPTADGIIEILQKGDEKQWSLVEEAMYDVVRATFAGYVAEESFNPETFDTSKLFWQAIANMPKEDRRSSNIPEEQWTGFVASYMEIMPSVTGKTPEQVKNATEVFIRKMVPLKSNKKMIEKLKEQLALYSQQPAAEQFSDVLELLLKRCDTYLQADDLAAIVGNL
jgi:hypothetical protein